MKNLIVSFIVILFISSLVKAQSYGLDNADPSLFTKYKIPDTDLHSLWFNTNLIFNSSKNSSYYNPSYYAYNINQSRSNVNLTYSLSPQYYLLKESEDRVLSLSFNASGSYNYQREVVDGENTNNYRDKTNDAQLNLILNFSYNKYADEGDLFYAFGSNISADFYDTQDNSSDRYMDNFNNYMSYKIQNYEVSAGIGWGRMRNVNAVVSAIRFQERLKQVNALSKDLDEKTIEDLAQKFSRAGYYADVYDRSGKYLWQDIEKTLANDGVSLSGLNQYADSYIRETLSEITIIRNEGFETSANIKLNYNNIYESTWPINEQFYTLLNGSMAYSHQLNLNSQISANLSLSGGPNVLANPVIRQSYFFIAGLGYDYEITDRVFATVHNNLSITFQNSEVPGRILNNDLIFVLHIFVEDNLSLAASYTWDYTDTRYTSYAWENEGNNHYVSIGFTYYIDRALIFN